MNETTRANYDGGGLVNLMRSLVEGLGASKTQYPPLDTLGFDEVGQARHVVLWVIDGLGYDYLTSRGRGSALQQHLRAPITSVFPATTASAITTLHTAVAPQQHGISGWHIYLREIGAVTAILPARPRFGGPALDRLGIDIAPLIASSPFFSRLSADPWIVTPQRLITSAYNTALTAGARRAGFSQLVEVLTLISRLCDGPVRRFVYAYWPTFDSLAHEHGVESQIAALHFADLDRTFEQLIARLRGSGTLLLVTADHGFIDTRPEDIVRLEDHPELEQCLALPLSGESRVAYCYVRHGKAEQFECHVGDELSHCCSLHRSSTLIEDGWFGSGPLAPALERRVGDYVLVAKDRYVIRDRVLGQSNFSPVGVHGGTSRAEMLVPLVVATP